MTEEHVLIHVAYSGILALVSQDIAAGTASVATLDRKWAVTSNRRRSVSTFPVARLLARDLLREYVRTSEIPMGEQAQISIRRRCPDLISANCSSGGRRAALFRTLIRTAVLNGLEPEAYLRDVIARIVSHPINRLAELLPWNWQPAATQSVAA